MRLEQPTETADAESTQAISTRCLYIQNNHERRHEHSENREDTHPEQGRRPVIFMEIDVFRCSFQADLSKSNDRLHLSSHPPPQEKGHRSE